MAEEERLSGSSAGPSPTHNPCPICLSPTTQESYLDQCFHKFCYHCIVKWINIVARRQSCSSSSMTCPLCKRENFSIICGYDGTSFQRHYVGKSLGDSEFFSEAHRYRLKCYYTDPGDIAEKVHVSLYWKFRKYLQQNHFLADWLRREIQAVMQEEDVDVIMHHVLGVIDSLRRDWSKKTSVSTEKAREEFRAAVSDAVRPFLTGRTERFVEELEVFVASGLNMDAFDEMYIKHLGWKESEKDCDETHEPTPAVPYLYIFDEDDHPHQI
ncbi:uncharacterized protein LOC130996950 [Salvia miltiorrhiza]|uniref:uncharacterized protein LOC130996950 n=1 Tax=Salvia miltiorrhiza TaxID=226208 RepID=UPI0025AC29B8|nr:uncharacterized protein LOC130996950 [Salvia miltiorrhiza]